MFDRLWPFSGNNRSRSIDFFVFFSHLFTLSLHCQIFLPGPRVYRSSFLIIPLYVLLSVFSSSSLSLYSSLDPFPITSFILLSSVSVTHPLPPVPSATLPHRLHSTPLAVLLCVFHPTLFFVPLSSPASTLFFFLLLP